MKLLHVWINDKGCVDKTTTHPKFTWQNELKEKLNPT